MQLNARAPNRWERGAGILMTVYCGALVMQLPLGFFFGMVSTTSLLRIPQLWIHFVPLVIGLGAGMWLLFDGRARAVTAISAVMISLAVGASLAWDQVGSYTGFVTQ